MYLNDYQRYQYNKAHNNAHVVSSIVVTEKKKKKSKIKP